MSAEVVTVVPPRKRGRPRKVERAEDEVQEIQRKKAASSKKLQDVNQHPQEEQTTKPASSAVRKKATAIKTKVSDSVVQAGLKSAKKATASACSTASTAPTVAASSSLSSSKILREIEKQRKTDTKDDRQSDHRDRVLAAAEVSDQQEKIAIEEAIAKDSSPELSASERKSEQIAESPKRHDLDSVAVSLPSTGSSPEERLTLAKKRREVTGSSISATTVSGQTTELSQSAPATLAPSSKILSALILEKKNTAKNSSNNNPPVVTPTESSTSPGKKDPMAKANGQPQPQKPKVLTPQEIKDLGSSPRRVPAARPTDIRQTKEYKVAARRWISTIVALPILFYTSWVLYERVYGGKKPKHLIERSQVQPKTQPADTSSSSSSSSSPVTNTSK